MPCGTTNPTDTCTGNVQNPPPAWWASQTYTSRYRIAHTVYNASQFDATPAVQRSWTPTENRTASMLYLYDRPASIYSGLACYFEQEVVALGGSASGRQATWCGTCSVASGTCTGGCRDLNFDNGNCGACGRACTAPAGTCCYAGCANLSSDVGNCGSCGNACQGQYPVCNSGTCSCKPCSTTQMSACNHAGLVCDPCSHTCQ